LWEAQLKTQISIGGCKRRLQIHRSAEIKASPLVQTLRRDFKRARAHQHVFAAYLGLAAAPTPGHHIAGFAGVQGDADPTVVAASVGRALPLLPGARREGAGGHACQGQGAQGDARARCCLFLFVLIWPFHSDHRSFWATSPPVT
jgi:hypothetical protein